MAIERVVAAVRGLAGQTANAGVDVGRLAVDREQHLAGVGVDAPGAVGVADPSQRVAGDLFDVDARRCGDLSEDHDQVGGHGRFAGDVGFGVADEAGIEHGVGDLVADLVRVTFGHRLRGPEAADGLVLLALLFLRWSFADAHVPSSQELR